MLTLSILIVTWNNEDVIGKCIDSIVSTLPSSEYKILIADNASFDDTVNIINKGYPAVELIRNDNNIGFGAANNQLILKSNSEYIVFLNPDTIVQKDALSLLINYLKLNPSIGAVGPQLLNKNGTLQLTDMRYPNWKTPYLDIISFRRAFGKGVMPAHLAARFFKSTDPVEVDWIMGACLMTRKEILDEIGSFDEKYFMYCEETELCHRIKRNGWRIIYLSASKVVHLGGEGLALYNSNKIIEIHKSQMSLLKTLLPYWYFTIAILGYYIKAFIRFCQWQIAFLDYNDLALDKMRGYLGVAKILISGGYK